jgi:hypothetical protein
VTSKDQAGAKGVKNPPNVLVTGTKRSEETGELYEDTLHIIQKRNMSCLILTH